MHTKLVYGAVLMAMTLFPMAAFASTPSATVEGVQMPVLLVRDGRLYPLNVGVSLKDNDQIRTGTNSRVLLRLAEGSLVKLGENAIFRVDNLQQDSKAKKVFSATLGVLKGAFRFPLYDAGPFKI